MRRRAFGVLLGGLWAGAWASGCRRGRAAAGARDATPAVLVHGIGGDGGSLAALAEHLRARGVPRVEAVTLRPSDGSVGIEALARQLDGMVQAVLRETGAAKVDLVGYSMGAVVTRYWIQRLGGKDRTRRYVSLAGPHHGVVAGYLSDRPAARDMRIGSPLLRALDADRDPWGPVVVFDYWTPLDLVIVPEVTASLPGARVRRRFLVRSHHEMSVNPRVLRAVGDALVIEALPEQHGPDIHAIDDELLRHTVTPR